MAVWKSTMTVSFVQAHKSFYFFFLSFNVYFWQKEHELRGAELEGDRRSEGGVCTDSSEPDAGLKFTDCEFMTWVTWAPHARVLFWDPHTCIKSLIVTEINIELKLLFFPCTRLLAAWGLGVVELGKEFLKRRKKYWEGRILEGEFYLLTAS